MKLTATLIGSIGLLTLAACATPTPICDREAQEWDKYGTQEDTCVVTPLTVGNEEFLVRIQEVWDREDTITPPETQPEPVTEPVEPPEVPTPTPEPEPPVTEPPVVPPKEPECVPNKPTPVVPSSECEWGRNGKGGCRPAPLLKGTVGC